MRSAFEFNAEVLAADPTDPTHQTLIPGFVDAGGIKRGYELFVQADLTFRRENPPGIRHDTHRPCHAHMARNQARLANNPPPGTVCPSTHRDNHDYTPHYDHPDIPPGSHRDVPDPDNLMSVLERCVESRCPHTTTTQAREPPNRRLRPIASSPQLTLPWRTYYRIRAIACHEVC
jgi:hypothetical protein